MFRFRSSEIDNEVLQMSEVVLNVQLQA